MNDFFTDNMYRGYTNLNAWAYGTLLSVYGKDSIKYFIEDGTESKYRVSESSIGVYVGLLYSKAIPQPATFFEPQSIYTGDIVMFKAGATSKVVERFAPDGIDKIIAVVKIKNGCVIFSSNLFYDGYVTAIDCCIDGFSQFDCEVLGNIYENSDILEKS